MAYQELNFRPGINKENTPYTQEGDWVDSDKIRFRSGKPEKIGGWQKYVDDRLFGTPRASTVWRALSGTIYTAFATEFKVYIEAGGRLSDITPVRATSSLTDAVSTTSGSTTLTVTDAAHGADDGAFVVISGADAVGGVPANQINTEHQVEVVDANTYLVTVSTAATSDDTGGGSFQAEYQINPGLSDSVFQFGWSAGEFGVDGWGTKRDEGIPIRPRLWSLQTWGEDLIINPRGGGVYIWDATTPEARATQITEAPHKSNLVLTTKDRHLVCFGCNLPGEDNATTPLQTLQVRWSQQENYNDWTPTSTNTAGSQLLTAGTEIVAAANTENQVIIWTDDKVESMQYLGPPYTFGFTQIGTSAGIVSSRAWSAYNNVIYWMGENAFYVFQGGTSILPCTVQRFVFDGLNIQQKDKVFTALDRENHEIIWFYPTDEIESTAVNGDTNSAQTEILVESTSSFPQPSGSIQIDDEIIDYTGKTDTRFLNCVRGRRGTIARAHSDEAVVSDPDNSGNQETSRYVSYNIVDNLWWVGRLERTSWVDRGALEYPIASDCCGFLYNHEIGRDANGDPLVSSVLSADFDLGNGDKLMLVRRFVPDFFVEGSVNVRMRTKYYPLSDFVQEAIGDVGPHTTRIDTRVRGRQLALRLKSKNVGDYWKYGDARIDQQPDGRR